MTKRIGKIEQFEFGSLSNGKHLHVTLAVSGFCGSDDDDGDVASFVKHQLFIFMRKAYEGVLKIQFYVGLVPRFLLQQEI